MKEIQKVANNSYTSDKWENAHIEWVGKAEHKLAINSTFPPQVGPYICKNNTFENTIPLKENPQLPDSPWGAMGLGSMSSAPTLRTHTRRLDSPTHFILKTNGAYLHETHKTLVIKKFLMSARAFATATSLGLRTQRTGKIIFLPAFSEKRFMGIL